MVFSKITNDFFYLKNGGDSILKLVNDNKALLIMHELYLLTNRYNKATISIDYLIEKCNYKINKQRQIDFKNILDKLKELKYIDFKDNIKSYSKTIEIDTNKLNVDSEFFVVEDEELEQIESNSTNKKEYLNLLKIYYYLKARIYKGNSNVKLLSGKAQTTFNTYVDIAEHTLISEGSIKKYIDKLQEIGLIRYSNLGYKYKADNKQLKTECANVYALIKVSKDEELLKADLKEGLKQQQYFYEEKGYIVTDKGYADNDKKLNGLYGSLIKKEKNNKLTDEEREELNKLKLIRELKDNTIDEIVSNSKNNSNNNDDEDVWCVC